MSASEGFVAAALFFILLLSVLGFYTNAPYTLIRLCVITESESGFDKCTMYGIERKKKTKQGKNQSQSTDANYIGLQIHGKLDEEKLKRS